MQDTYRARAHEYMRTGTSPGPAAGNPYARTVHWARPDWARYAEVEITLDLLQQVSSSLGMDGVGFGHYLRY